ncbi:MAG TPA: EamA family transporter [Draconibacterium sp.]|nr:EamA family transporter [Draconibacterium sp.]
MIQLIAAIISSSLIFVLFRLAKNYQSRLSALITYNYLAASLLGLLLFKPFSGLEAGANYSWIPFAVVNGLLFIGIFFLIGQSSQKAGITVTTLATKLSVVFPVLFSIVYFNEQISNVRAIGLIAAFIAIGLTLYKKDLNKTKYIFILLPLTIFVGSGVVDSIVKFVQEAKMNPGQSALYTTVVFMVAFSCGMVISSFSAKRQFSIHPPTLFLGTMLGIVNFGSLYFLIEALNKSNLKSSMVFAINNMSIVTLTAILGWFLFKERLNKINLAGIVMALLSIYFLL